MVVVRDPTFGPITATTMLPVDLIVSKIPSSSRWIMLWPWNLALEVIHSMGSHTQLGFRDWLTNREQWLLNLSLLWLSLTELQLNPNYIHFSCYYDRSVLIYICQYWQIGYLPIQRRSSRRIKQVFQHVSGTYFFIKQVVSRCYATDTEGKVHGNAVKCQLIFTKIAKVDCHRRVSEISPP